ncbi:MAG: type II secretion system inner membrane protein GspF [Myxococcota bacterium]|nr:type II secretion system inner membrane protein GspF [Myxococcota bacterium]
MPVYAYKGLDSSGKTVNGTKEAESPKAIKALLRRDGVYLTDLKESGPAKKKKDGKRSSFQLSFLSERVSSQDLAVSTRQLATLVGAGITLVEAINALIDQIDNPTLKGVWSAVKQRVNEGAPMADALGEHPRIFTGLYCNMVRAGESSGALDIVLDRLADFTESQAELRSKLVGTLIYPVVMLVMAIGVTALLFVVVVPKITRIFESQKMALPLPTEILIGISNILINYWLILVILTTGGLYFARRYIRSEKGRPKWDNFKLTAPIFGPLIQMIAIARFSRTLATLLSSGVPLLTAFDIVKNVVQNEVLVEVIENARDCVKEGDSIAAPLKRSGHFPPMVVHMIGIGEKSGQLEPMLGNVARSYEVQIDARLRGLTSLLEPLIIVGMGVVVAAIVLAILLPIMQLSSAI